MRDLLSRNGVEFIVESVRLAPWRAPGASDAHSGPTMAER
jgi:hypothetical protein